MSENKTFLDRQPIFLQILMLLGIMGASVLIFTVISMVLVRPLYGVIGADSLLVKISTDPDSLKGNSNEINAFRFIQLFSTTIGLFLAPAIVFGLIKRYGRDYLKFRKPFNPLFIILSLLVFISAGPIVNLLQDWNEGMKLPHFLKGIEDMMKSSEETNAKATELLLEMPRLSDFIFNFFVIGIMTAIAEEAFFRGVLQQLFREAFKNVHVAIWVGAAVFSALHFEFYGFVPRLVLGALLGYLFYWSGNLWVPIVGHLINNGAQVVLVYLHQQGKITYDISTDQTIPVYVTIISTILLAGLLYLSYKSRTQEPQHTDEPDEPESINPTLDSNQWQ